MSFDVQGTLHKKFDTEQKTDSFKAREFVIEVKDGNYQQLIKFQLVQDRCEALDPFNEGEEILVTFDLRGREWNEKFFTNLNAWRLAKVATGAAAAAPVAGKEATAFPTAENAPSFEVSDDDLPF